MPATYRPKNKLYGDDPGYITQDKPYLIKCFFGTIFFYIFSPLILNIASWVPDFDTGSQLYENFYYR